MERCVLTDPPLDEQDVRAMVRLLGEVIAVPGDIHAKRRMLMDGLCVLINASVWMWRRTGTQMESVTDAMSSGDSSGTFREDARIGALPSHEHAIPGGGTSVIGIYREAGCADFSDRDARLANILLSEIPWLHWRAFPNQRQEETKPLYPRHRTVLNFLGDGWSRKKIAAHLGISENTIHGYVKDIYRHFEVHSQSELLARFAQGKGDDK